MVSIPTTLNRGLERGWGSFESTMLSYPVSLNRGLERGYGAYEPVGMAYETTLNRGLERGYGAYEIAVDRAQLPLNILFFKMRAYKTSAPTGYVYWDAPNEPDSIGELAPYPSGDLADIVVEAIFEKDD
jgi:hypothetical protein